MIDDKYLSEYCIEKYSKEFYHKEIEGNDEFKNGILGTYGYALYVAKKNLEECKKAILETLNLN